MKNFTKMKQLLFALWIAGMFFVSCHHSQLGSSTSKETQCWDEDAVFPLQIDADRYASFKEGDKALVQFIASHTKYPLQAKENGEQGKVFVRFVVQKDGSIRDAEVVRGISKSLDEEAKRVALLADGMWKPGTKNGKAVNVYMTLPVYFKLN